MRSFLVFSGLRGVLAFWFYVGLACAGWALSPPPGGFKEPTYEEMWAGSERVFYGTVVRLERKEGLPHYGDHEVAIKVERAWKGEMSGIVLLAETTGSSMRLGYRFEFDRTYVVFAERTEGGTYFLRRHAAAARLPEPRVNSLSHIFGDAPPEPERLVTFLDAKVSGQAAMERYEELERARAQREQAAREKEKEEREAPLNALKAELATALREKGVAERKVILEALDKKLVGKYEAEFKELKDVVAKELSLAETYFKNGLKRFQ